MGNRAPKHLSLLRSYTVADFFTAGNASCGSLSIFLCLKYSAEGTRDYIWSAMALLVVALVCDVMDGYWARRSRRPSVLGAELDSLADAVSFGVAPAVLGFTLGLRGGWDLLILVFFIVCGISRLARFNVTAEQLADARGKVEYFEGTPIPTSLVIVGLLAVAFGQGAIQDELWLGSWEAGAATLHPLALVYALSGMGMVSATIRIPKP
jgi:CDP-diacylglycerol--serine O-phosphatidyltransferase